MSAVMTLRALSRQAVAAALAPVPAGERFLLIDATAGNGQDTLLLAQLASSFPAATVHAFDVQPRALARAAARLAGAGFADRLPFLHLRGHETAARTLAAFHAPDPVPPPRAVMFNLGFLPAGDRRLTTTAAATTAAVSSFLPLLPLGGLISIHMYAGHPGGAGETQAVIALLEALPEHEWAVALYFCPNKRKNPETLALLERRG